MENVRRETTPIYDDAFMEHELDKQNLSVYEADSRREAELQRVRHDYNHAHRVALQRILRGMHKREHADQETKRLQTMSSPSSSRSTRRLRAFQRVQGSVLLLYVTIAECYTAATVHSQQSYKRRATQGCTQMQQNECEWTWKAQQLHSTKS
eukprot:1750606-Amphidinium_carterae.2